MTESSCALGTFGVKCRFIALLGNCAQQSMGCLFPSFSFDASMASSSSSGSFILTLMFDNDASKCWEGHQLCFQCDAASVGLQLGREQSRTPEWLLASCAQGGKMFGGCAGKMTPKGLQNSFWMVLGKTRNGKWILMPLLPWHSMPTPSLLHGSDKTKSQSR